MPKYVYSCTGKSILTLYPLMPLFALTSECHLLVGDMIFYAAIFSECLFSLNILNKSNHKKCPSFHKVEFKKCTLPIRWHFQSGNINTSLEGWVADWDKMHYVITWFSSHMLQQLIDLLSMLLI